MAKSIQLKHGFSVEDFPKAKDIWLAKGDLFLYEGDVHKGNCFLILEGTLDIRLISGNGHENSTEYQKNGDTVGDKVWLIDFENPLNNDLLVCNQFTVVENEKTKRV